MAITTDYTVFYGIYDNTGERFFLMLSSESKKTGLSPRI